MTNIIQQDALPFVQQSFDLEFNESDSTFEIADFDQIIDSLNEMLSRSEQYEYHPDDRQDVKSLRAATNKMSKAIKDKIKKQEKDLFEKPRQQEKEMSSLISSIQKNITKGIDAEDARLKEQKTKALKEMFNDAIQYYDELDGLEYKQIANSKWLNRSYSEGKATTDLNERLKILNQIIVSIDDYDLDINDVAKVANNNDWDGLTAVNEINKAQQEKLEQQREAYEAELKRKELEESNEFIDDKTSSHSDDEYASLQIKQNDLQKVKKLLQARGIYFKIEG